MKQLCQIEIECLYSLDDRINAVRTFTHAIDYLNQRGGLVVTDIQARTLLSDGICNAIDSRSTGREWRTVRHRYNNERDGPHPPAVADEDRRCYTCGAVNPEPFSHCWDHNSTRLMESRRPRLTTSGASEKPAEGPEGHGFITGTAIPENFEPSGEMEAKSE